MRINRWVGRAAVLGAAASLATGTITTPALAASAPGGPDAERISAGPYEGFQMCQTSGTLRVNSASPTLAASPTRPAGSTLPPFAPFPGLTATFEVAQLDGRLLLQRQTQIENGRLFAFQVPQGSLANGQFQWRVRAQDGAVASPWTPWCIFTLSS